MRIVCLGGGPAGLYFAISMKLRDPAHEVRIVERNRAGDTFGWGVVFSDQTLENLQANDPVSAATIAGDFARWDDIDVVVDGVATTSSGHGFIGIGRKRLLAILQHRARNLGVKLDFETEFSGDLSPYADYDLIVVADGVNSRVREAHAERFDVNVETRANKFVWLGTTKLFDTFAFLFEKTDAGWIWAHAYRFDAERSTFIVECSEETWRGLGFDTMEPDEAQRACETIFARHLDGHALVSNAGHLRGSSAWINFRRVLCGRWSFDNVVLLGDAAHTAHFSIGSGTKLALEDAIKLAQVLDRGGLGTRAGMAEALEEYRAERHVEVLRIQNSARNSTEWFETLDRYLDFDPLQFAYALMTRSQRVSHENLRLRDPDWLGSVERWFAGTAGVTGDVVPPPLFTPFRLRGITLANRVVVSPVLIYAAGEDGVPNDTHLVHYGARAQGGAGLVMTEMAAILPDGRASTACPGLWNDAQAAAWRRITDFAHANSAAAIGVQLGHAGARAGFSPRPSGPAEDWPRVSASAAAWMPGNPVPAAITRTDMTRIRDAFVDAARRAIDAGFDLIEIQAGHGFLLSSFITPAMNAREDEFGGSFENRMRFPLDVVRAVREVWPADRPLAVRISANDWIGDAGITPADAVRIARAFVDAGCDVVDVSSGETAADGKPVYGRLYQTPFADRVRNEARVATIAVGNITDPDQANSILVSGRADLVAIGRPYLVDPMWTLRAAATLGWRGIDVPAAYQPGQAQLTRLLQQAVKIPSV